MFKQSICVALLLTLLATTSSTAQQTYIHAGKLISCVDESVQQEKTIVIEDDKIVSIEDGYIESEDAILIDLRECTVMPGLMDMHTHLMLSLIHI